MLDLSQCAAFVCEEVASGKFPILYARRSRPIEDADSGWQFDCGVVAGNEHKALIWAVREVLEIEPSLAPFINNWPGIVLTRESLNDPWKVGEFDAESED